MKKSNTHLINDEIDLRDLIRKLWKEKILILSISIIFGLLGYLYQLLKPQEQKSEIILKNPPMQIFEPYNFSNINNNNNNNNNNSNNIAIQFISDFKLNLLSLDNVQNFIEESKEFDNFKEYLKSRNISAKQYFSDDKFAEVKEKNIIIPNKYFLNHPKELDGVIFFDKYVEFIKKKTIAEFKNNLKLTLLNTINTHQEALEIAKKIQLENPIINTSSQQQVVTEPEALFYKGSKVLSEKLNYFNKRLIKLENDQLNYNTILQKALTLKNPKSLNLYFVFGLMLGLFLSLAIIYLKNILK